MGFLSDLYANITSGTGAAVEIITGQPVQITGPQPDVDPKARVAAQLSTEELCRRAKEAKLLSDQLNEDRDVYLAELGQRLDAHQVLAGKKAKLTAGPFKVQRIESSCLDQAAVKDHHPEIVAQYRLRYSYVKVT